MHKNTVIMSKNKSKKTAWVEAQEYGIDTTLLEANLRLSIGERLRRHDAALNTILALRKAVRKGNLE